MESGYGSPFRIMILIREELPQCWRSAEVCALWALLVIHVKLDEVVSLQFYSVTYFVWADRSSWQ